VIADTSTLQTLSPREYRAGLAEVVKYGFIRDVAFLRWIETNVEPLLARDAAAVIHAVRRSCEIKAEVVAQDEREHGLRAILNLGHTFGHAIETAAGYGTWLHGEAVAAGMVLAAEMSERVGWLEPTERDRAVRLIARLGLPVAPPRIGAQRGRELMGMDKKVLAGRIRLVLLRELGRATVVDDYDEQAFDATLQAHFG
jgi:3-dehydroquinate synthase